MPAARDADGNTRHEREVLNHLAKQKRREKKGGSLDAETSSVGRNKVVPPRVRIEEPR